MPSNDAVLRASIEARIDRLSGQLSTANRLFGGFAASQARTVAQIKAKFDTLGDGVGGSFKSAERQITDASAAIRKQILLIGTTVGATFAADRVKEFADGYTRFTNQLKIAGQSGDGLVSTQSALFATAQKYGVELEGLGTLYSRAAQAGDSLNATQAQLLKFTNGVAAGLKIQGGAADQTKGALLQLSQLLGTGTVRAEEFNSVNEGARPILQAVASGIDKYKGSVAALRNDVIAGKVTSQAFFDGFLRGSAELEAKATKANLTIGASFVILNNAIGKYIGETDSGLSATQRFSQGMQALAGNLDTIIPALAIIGVGLGARTFGPMIQGATAAAIAAGQLRIQNELGTATLLGSANALRQKAALTAELAAGEAAEASARVAELQAEAALIRENIGLTEGLLAAENARRGQAAANAAAGFARVTVGAGAQSKGFTGGEIEAERSRLQQGLIASSQSLTRVEGELAAAEVVMAGATTRAAAAQTAQAAAITASSVAARVGAASMAALEATMAFFGGPIGVAILALTAAILANNAALDAAEKQAHASAAAVSELRAALDQAARYGGGAASQIQAVGTQAQAGVGPLKAFAGAVGEAANKLAELAKQRRNEAISALEAARAKAAADLPRLQEAAQEARQRQISPTGPIEPGSRGAAAGAALAGANAQTFADQAQAQAKAQLAAQQAIIAKAASEIARLQNMPLTGFVNATDRTGGRDVAGELRDLTAQLKAAQAAHNGAAIRELQAQIYVRKQTTKYMQQGLSFEIAQTTAQAEAAKIKDAGDAYASGAAGKKASRAAAAAQRKAEAEARKAEAERVKGVRDDKAFDGEVRRAELDYLDAVAKTSDSAKDRLNIELERIKFAAEQRDKEIAAEGPTTAGGTGKFSAAEVARLQTLNEQTATQDSINAIIEDTRRTIAQELSLRLASLSDQQEIAQLQSGLARTAKSRRDVELRILALQEEEERSRLAAITVANGATAAEEAIAKARLGRLDQIYGLKKQGVEQQTQGPVEAFITANQGADQFLEKLQTIGVQGFDNLADSLAQAVVAGEDLGDVLNNTLRQVIAQILSASIKNVGADLAAATLKFIPGFAAGTDNAPGGLAYVHRDELVNLPKGAQVIPSHALHAAATLTAQPIGRAVTVYQPLSFDLRGAITTADFMADVDRKIVRSQRQAVAQAVGISDRNVPSRMAQFQRLGR